MFMCCLTSLRYLKDSFKIYQIIYLKDICDLYLEDILKIYGFDISVFPTYYYRKCTPTSSMNMVNSRCAKQRTCFVDHIHGSGCNTNAEESQLE